MKRLECLLKSRPVLAVSLLKVEEMWWTVYALLLTFWVGQWHGFVVIDPSRPAHCWDNIDCNGSFSQSFLRESDCCTFGGAAYIKCTKEELKAILMNASQTARTSCVRCPAVVPQTTVKPNGVCTATTCPQPDTRCVVIANVNITFCDECDLNSGQVCGSDGLTYKHECKMYRTNINKSMNIDYMGPCRSNPTCATVTCKTGHQCKIKPGTNGPLCYKNTVICGSDGTTYASVHDMLAAVCNTQRVIFQMKAEPCNVGDTPLVVKPRNTNCALGTSFPNSINGR